MPTKRKTTNYEKYQTEIIALASRGSVCFNCLARDVCDNLCKTRGLDKGKDTPPCREAWFNWSEESID